MALAVLSDPSDLWDLSYLEVLEGQGDREVRVYLEDLSVRADRILPADLDDRISPALPGVL
jgi:hypothetical protein